MVCNVELLLWLKKGGKWTYEAPLPKKTIKTQYVVYVVNVGAN